MAHGTEFFKDLFFADYSTGSTWVEAGGTKVIYWTDKNPTLSASGTQIVVSSLSGSELDIAKSAFNEWDEVLDSLEFKYTTDPSKAQISIGWSTLISSWGHWYSSWINDIRQVGEIQLNQNLRYTSLVSSTNLKHTLLHEIGNIIGLGDISPDSGIDSVLVDPFNITGYLSQKDKEYAKLLYHEDASQTPTYNITTVYETVNEGESAVFNLTTTNVDAGTKVFYTWNVNNSVQTSDFGYRSSSIYGLLNPASVIIDNNGNATINLPIKPDEKTEGDETLTVSITGTSASVIIKDTSLSKTTTEGNTLTILVDKNIVGPDPIFLKNLEEEIIYTGDSVTSHTLTYLGNKYEYSDIDSAITTVVRNGNFTDEFRKEISDLAPNLSNISYNDVVTLVGVVNVDSVLSYIAGYDGNYVA